ncbi:MAG: hypothetical protein MK291_07335 [Planctomycetes bacterium]|nr:hypothetical protein [Planctomycetota bacterium]
MNPLWLPLLIIPSVDPLPATGEAPVAQYVRIEVQGEGKLLKAAETKDGVNTPAVYEGRILSLAEVEIFSGRENVAPKGVASQSTTYQGGGAGLAIDGILDGAHSAGSVSHTDSKAADGAPPLEAWWEVDLSAPLPIDQITIWNRTDCCQERLRDYDLVLLDADRQEVMRLGPNPSPPIYRDHLLSGPEPRRSKASLAKSHQLQTKINVAIDRGIDWLKRAQHRDGSWRGHHGRHPTGLTALSAYALVKSGVKKDDHTIQRAVNWLRQVPCEDTYSAGCLLMLLASLEDEEHLDWAEEITDMLIETQGGGGATGLWAYPWGSWDFSCSQYAALGLRAASSMGVKVPRKTWERLIEGTLEKQYDPQVIDAPPGMEGRTGTGYRLAGFSYRDPNENGPTGSMTTAGIACLQIGLEGVGARGSYAQRVKRGVDYAINWLTVNFSVSRNPGMNGRHRYYLYGLERVGGLLEREMIGPYNWYEAGADNLTKRQGGGGEWSNETETCYALLFLNKATASSTGGGAKGPGDKLSFAAEGEETELWLRGSNSDVLTVWLSGFPDWVLEDFTPSEELVPEVARGLRLVRVEYSIDGEIVARIPGDPEKAWRGERFPFRHTFKTRGEYEVTARAFVLGPEAMPGDADGVEELLSGSFKVPVEGLLEDWMIEYSEAGGKNLLKTVEASAVVSSERNRGNHESKEKENEALAKEAAHVLDGFEFTNWACAADDPKPTLTVRLPRPVRARRILLSPAGSNLFDVKSYDRIVKARVTINGDDDEPYEVAFPEDNFQKGLVEFKKAEKIRSFKVEILERVKQDGNHGKAGFSEVSLER